MRTPDIGFTEEENAATEGKTPVMCDVGLCCSFYSQLCRRRALFSLPKMQTEDSIATETHHISAEQLPQCILHLYNPIPHHELTLTN